MDPDLHVAYELVNQAVKPEDVYGRLVDRKRPLSQEELLEEAHGKLAKVLSPEVYKSSPSDHDFAEDAFLKLEGFYQNAKERIGTRSYGKAIKSIRYKNDHRKIKTKKREYYLGNKIVDGTVSEVYEGEAVGSTDLVGRVIVKISKSPEMNSYIQKEAKQLRFLHGKGGIQSLYHLPVLLDVSMTSDGRALLIMHYLEGFYDLHDVKRSRFHQGGVHKKHISWIVNRLLGVVGYAHYHGVIHGNIEPAHIFLKPDIHNVVLIDWCFSIYSPAKTGESYSVKTPIFSAPEVSKGILANPSTDLYSVGSCMIHLLNGNTETGEIPGDVEKEFKDFICSLADPNPRTRRGDAWKAHADLRMLVIGLWGPKKFLEFRM